MRIGSTISLEELWNYLTNGEDIPYRRVESAFGTLVRLGEDHYETCQWSFIRGKYYHSLL